MRAVGGIQNLAFVDGSGGRARAAEANGILVVENRLVTSKVESALSNAD
ncbi:MAG TPA: hypothetical protein VIH95_06320 [Acidimicrobiales bacterium]